MLLAVASHAGRAAEVWSPNPLVSVFEGPDYSGSGDPECVLRIVGTRNGAFSGQVVVFSKEPVKGRKAGVSDLRLKGGDGVIPVSAVRVSYALPTGWEKTAGKRFPGIRNLKRFDALWPEPRGEGRTHPVWVTVSVPKDAKPGTYEGNLSVAGREVPVRLTVCGWALPEPGEFVTHVGMIQSPEAGV